MWCHPGQEETHGATKHPGPIFSEHAELLKWIPGTSAASSLARDDIEREVINHNSNINPSQKYSFLIPILYHLSYM